MKNKFLKLKGRIVEKYGTVSNFCEKNGFNRQTVYCKLSGLRGISKNDMNDWSKILDIPVSEYYDYYF